MGYEETLREHARLAMLRFMEDAPGYRTNVSMLTALLPGVGIILGRDQIMTEAHWLQEQGLAECEDLGAITIVTATTRGIEVAKGIVKVPGVQRPRPGA
jgi:hypothetical protein